MKPKVLVDIAMHPKAMERLQVYCDVITDRGDAAYCEGMITYTAQDRLTLGEYPRLKAVACHSYEEEFGAWAGEKRIAVNTVPSLWRTVAEHTVGLMMAVSRNIAAADKAVRRGEWQNHHDLKVRFSGYDFQRKTLGIWGLGQIGLEIARMVSGFDMKVLYNDILGPVEGALNGIKSQFCPFKQLLECSDYLIVMVPLNERTRGSFGEAEFSRVKRGCILVNAARAGIIDEAAFDRALSDGTLSAAAIDVTWQEPMEKDHPLLCHDNLIVTPHLGGSTYECDLVLVNAVIETLALKP